MSLSENISFRKAKEKDIEACSRIMAEEYNKPPYNQEWEEETAAQRLYELLRIYPDTSFVIETNKNIIGFIFCSVETTFNGKCLYVHDFVISAENQGKGIGTNTLELLKKYAKENELNEISLNAYLYSFAYTFYKKLGFKESDFRYLSKDVE